MPMSKQKMKELKGGTAPLSGCIVVCYDIHHEYRYFVPMNGCGDFVGITPCMPSDTVISCSCQSFGR